MTGLPIIRQGALGDIICLLNLSSQIKRHFWGLTLYSHEVYHEILKDFIKDNDLCHFVSLQRERPPKETLELVMYPIRDGYPNFKPVKHLVHYVQNEICLPETNFIPALELLSPRRPKECETDRKIITIQSSTGWSRYKEYPHNEELIEFLPRDDFKIIQIGGVNDKRIRGVEHYALSRSFSEQITFQCWADLHVGPDSVFNHTSNFSWSHKKSRTPAVIYFGSTSPILSGYHFNDNVTLGHPCQPCFRENPEISKQRTDECPFNHQCLKSLTPKELADRIIQKSHELQQ